MTDPSQDVVELDTLSAAALEESDQRSAQLDRQGFCIDAASESGGRGRAAPLSEVLTAYDQRTGIGWIR